MMLAQAFARRATSATIATALRPASGVSIGSSLINSNSNFNFNHDGCNDSFVGQQTRTMVTKKRVHRQEKRKRKAKLAEQGIFPPKPHMYIDRDSQVKNAVSREERDAESKRQDELAAAELKAKLEIVKEPKLLRFGFEDSDLVISDRVRKLLDLHNGNQREVVKAQKRRGMELFEMREGDTGSSGVQVIALTTRIQQIQTHLRAHKKDKHSKRGLDALYVRRRKVLDYMERKEFETYRKVVKTLGLIH